MIKQYKLVRSQFELLETIRQCDEWAWVGAVLGGKP